MSNQTMQKLYKGEHIKTKELIFIREELEHLSVLLVGLGEAFHPFQKETLCRLEQVTEYLFARNVSHQEFTSRETENNFVIAMNVSAFVNNNRTSFSSDEVVLMRDRLLDIQLSASNLGQSYVMLESYIYTLMEKLNKIN